MVSLQRLEIQIGGEHQGDSGVTKTFIQPDAGPSYRRKEPFILTEHHKRAMAGAIAEVDPKQIAVLRTLSTEQRFRQAISMIAFAEKVAVFQLRRREPELTEEEAYYIVRSENLAAREAKRRAQRSTQV
ncbi:MAG: hypothetical protein AAF639_07065 [Chloroflexota bacterium]